MIFEIVAGLTKKGSFLFLLNNLSEKEILQIREESFFYKDDQKFKTCSENNIYSEYDLIKYRKQYKFENIDQAKIKILELMSEEMTIRGNVVSDKNSLYLELLGIKEKYESLSKEFSSLEERLNRLDQNINGPKSY